MTGPSQNQNLTGIPTNINDLIQMRGQGSIPQGTTTIGMGMPQGLRQGFGPMNMPRGDFTRQPRNFMIPMQQQYLKENPPVQAAPQPAPVPVPGTNAPQGSFSDAAVNPGQIMNTIQPYPNPGGVDFSSLMQAFTQRLAPIMSNPAMVQALFGNVGGPQGFAGAMNAFNMNVPRQPNSVAGQVAGNGSILDGIRRLFGGTGQSN